MRTIIDNIRTYFLMALGLRYFSGVGDAILLPQPDIRQRVSTGLAAIIFNATGKPMGYTYFANKRLC
jgi:hypothetical protein